MNRHFEDSRYYLGRAVETAAEGVREELEPLEERFREMTGREAEPEPEPDRLERVQARLEELEARAEGEAKQAISKARERLESYRAEA